MKNLIEPKINEVFELFGKHFKCIKDNPRQPCQGCQGCAFLPDGSGCAFMNCDKFEREDSEYVIFKEVINDRD